MISKILTAAVLTLLTVTAPARADEPQPTMTVGDLQEFCTASDAGGKAACQFFIFGVAMGVRLAAATLGDKTHYCIPDDLSSAAMELAVKLAIGQDLMIFPADRDLEASGFVGAALIKAFPCSKRKPNRQ
jgi:hypothetical protein